MAKSVLIDRDLGWRELFRKITRGGEAFAKIGIQQDTRREQKDGKGPIDMVQLAAIHEFGAPKAGIPERSFIRAWHDSHRAQITQLQARLGRQFIDGKITLRQMIAKLGAFGQGGIRKFIVALKQPILAKSTVRRRRKGTGKNKDVHSDNPLVDTGQLVASVFSISVIRGVEVERTGP
ncbi:MAG: hypothetical protein QGD90_00145 [Candidatus Hydrogenedentes bacterium]|nr:hypothetical protein [Candidatus Hydrogenedentota bacterium]